MKFKLLFSALLFSSSLFAEVNWQTLNWQQAKDLAKKENKNLFVDAYTDWCGWCKVMDRQTFPDEKVSAYMNEHFVSIKIDMEKGFGIDLAHKFGVSGYPTYLLFNSNGDLVKISVGYKDAEPFLAMLKENAMPPTQRVIPGYSQIIPLNYPDFLIKMWSDKKYKPSKEEVAAYFHDSKDHFSEIYWAVLSRFYKYDDAYFQQIADNRDKYRNLFGTSAVNDIFFAHLYPGYASALKSGNEDDLNTFIKNLSAYQLPADEETINGYRLGFYMQTSQWKKMMEELDQYIKINGETAKGLNSYCWTVYEKCDDVAIVKRAANIMKKVTDAHPAYAEMDTYAALLYKSKDYEEAEKVAGTAIELGKKEKTDVSGTEELLKKIKEAE